MKLSDIEYILPCSNYTPEEWNNMGISLQMIVCNKCKIKNCKLGRESK